MVSDWCRSKCGGSAKMSWVRTPPYFGLSPAGVCAPARRYGAAQAASPVPAMIPMSCRRESPLSAIDILLESASKIGERGAAT